jgi:hypothetical protein
MSRSHGISTPRRSICGICGEPTNKPTRMCADCAASHEKFAMQDGSIMESILWAARRARWYAERRRAKGIPLTDWELHHLQDFAHNVDDYDHDKQWAKLDNKLRAEIRKRAR